MSGTLPTVVVGGYLGAGKTTLVNHLLRHAAGRRIAVMVNDFGEIGIDADLVESRDDDVMNLAGGCVCCAFGSDLIGALMALPERDPRPDLVLIETSGVALPGSVARSVRLAPGIEVDGVVVLADAETVRARADDPYVGDTVRQQLAEADLLILNKVELVSADALAGLRGWIASVAPRARIVETSEARVPPELVIGLHDGDAGTPREAAAGGLLTGGGRRIAAPPAAAALFESASFEIDATVDAQALGRALADPSLWLVRAKGIVRDRDGRWTVLQAVGPRVRVTAADEAALRSPGSRGRVVAIGLRGRFDAAAVRARIDAAAASEPPPAG
jgi:G3E family GTPase